MGIVLGDNIDYKGKKPLDSRMLFDTIADMKEYSENYLPDITLAFNKEDGKMYVFNRTNDVDGTTGKWREFEGGATPEVIPEVSTVAELGTYLDGLTDKDYHKVNLTAVIQFPTTTSTMRLESSVYAVQRVSDNSVYAFRNDKIYQFGKSTGSRTVRERTDEYMKSDVYELEMDTAYTVEDFFDEVSISVRNHSDVIYVDQYGTGTLTTTDGTEIAGEFHMILDAGNDNGIRGGKIYQFNEDGEYVEQYNVMVDVAEGTINVIKKEGTKSVYLTQTEFNTLTQEEQDDPTKDYYIISNESAIPAEEIKIADLEDVEITNPTNGQIMSFDETSEKRKNVELQQKLVNIESESLYKNASLRMSGDDVIPLIIIAGQSNADGRAPYTSLPNRDETKRLSDNGYDVDDYMMWNDTNKTFATYNVRTNNGAGTDNGDDGAGVDKFSFDPFFARFFINTYNKPLYALRVTLGGIPIGTTTNRAGANNTWNAKIGYFETQGQTNVRYLCKVIADRIKDIKERAETNNKTILPIAVLWHQGEGDGTAERIPYYKQNLKNVISFIRGIVGDPKLPFINAFINKNYKPTEYTQINNIYLELNKEDQFMKTVDMEGHYTSIGDNLHFDGQAFAYMGQKMFEYYKLYDYTPNEREAGVDITSVFGNTSIAGRTWSGSGMASIRTLEEFANLTPAINEIRSCGPNAIAWSDYKNNYRKIRITPLTPSIKVYFATNSGVDDTIFKINGANWIAQTMTFDCTGAHDLIISIQFDTGSSNTISDIVKVEVIA